MEGKNVPRPNGHGLIRYSARILGTGKGAELFQEARGERSVDAARQNASGADSRRRRSARCALALRLSPFDNETRRRAGRYRFAKAGSFSADLSYAREERLPSSQRSAVSRLGAFA